MRQDVLEEQLTREELQALRNRRTGMFIFQVSWIMAFVCLVIVNWQMRFSPQWLPPGSEPMGVMLPTIATAALLLSAWLARRALLAVQVGHSGAFLKQWQAAIGLGILFVAIMLYEWAVIPTGTQYAQVFRLMTGFHAFHAFVIGGYMIGVYAGGRRGQYGPLDFWAVEAGAKLWYFVVIAWILFYIVIYWI
jgi:heme/copper-type cytochrome/quinol oxidase subunit 3